MLRLTCDKHDYDSIHLCSQRSLPNKGLFYDYNILTIPVKQNFIARE